MNDIEINGKGAVPGGDLGKVTINGMASGQGLLRATKILVNGSFSCPGVLGADQIQVNGNFTCDGDVNADTLRVDGRMKCRGALTAVRVNCDGVVDVGGDVYVSRLDIDGMFKVVDGTKLEASLIDCDGFLKIDGQISADVLKADGFVNAQEIVGDKITIHSSAVPGFLGILNIGIARFSSHVDLIEATTIKLKHVTVGTVNGQDVVIGPGCQIDHLDCNGTLSIASTAVVRNITGNFTRVG